MNLSEATNVLSSLRPLRRQSSMKGPRSFSALMRSAKSGMGKFSGSFLSIQVYQAISFLVNASGNSLKKATWSLPKWWREIARTFIHCFSDRKPTAFARSVLASRAAPDLRKSETSFEEIFYQVCRILKQTIKINVILSFSNRPRFTYLYTLNVSSFMMFSTRFELTGAGGAESIESMKSFRNCSKDELYIQFTSATSIIEK